jgi:hypothetical protein
VAIGIVDIPKHFPNWMDWKSCNESIGNSKKPNTHGPKSGSCSWLVLGGVYLFL